jgi:diguanylate cyclase (GGDEF)-like protein
VAAQPALRQQAVLIMLDIDHFKQVNDEYGHDVGDRVIERVAMLLLEHIRAIDTAIRYGGEEFLLVLPQTTLEGGMQLAERLRQQMAAEPCTAMRPTLRSR